MSTEVKNDLAKIFRATHDKFVYFLMAISTSAIGFAITQINIEPLSYSHIPLGIALGVWALSFYFGIKVIEGSLSTIYLNYGMVGFENELNSYQTDERLLFLKKEGDENFQKATDKIDKEVRIFSALQKWCLYVGVFCYVGWYVLRMYQASV